MEYINQYVSEMEANMESIKSNYVNVWEEQITLPTYEIGEAEKNPIFLEKRVYQGSTGKVYPYPVVEKISDEKVDKVYQAVYLENPYLKVMILPELGGRIQRAYDKTNDYDFVYYNHVIKPALVGLVGPWISGGIEFNWPQHHRPTTYMPVEYQLQEHEDGSKSVLVHDVDRMYGTQSIAAFTLYPDKAYIEISGQLYNRTALAQTFLWWANPAVPVNDYTQSIFPPDVHAVMDHGKRDVSRFPIATGEYYKMDYSAGVDISMYKNILVPTSYMAQKSKYDFVGGYDYQKQAGILHVADHHISPGKKQWTWGCGDFGQAWDDNLTDTDGPYVELMTGVYTDNQPDFTWLKPFEEKTFKQYFMPYKAVGQVKNATIDVVMNMEKSQDTVDLVVYASSEKKLDIIIEYNDDVIYEASIAISPVKTYAKEIPFCCESEVGLKASIFEQGKLLLSYAPESQEIEPIPDPAKAVEAPQLIQTNEELLLAGMHIEQYRHATYLPDPYYLEGLKRDAGDIRINNAYGTLLLRRGDFDRALEHFNKALERLIRLNPNPYDSETYYNLGLTLFYLHDMDGAYDAFYKATWTNEQQEMAFYYLAAIDCQKKRYEHALEMIDKALTKNTKNIKARGLKAYVLRKLKRIQAHRKWCEESLTVDSFHGVLLFEEGILKNETSEKVFKKSVDNMLLVARDYAEFGAYEEAIMVLKTVKDFSPLVGYYLGYYAHQLGKDDAANQYIQAAEQAASDYCFPNQLEDIEVLRYAINQYQATMAAYYLGNVYYDKLQWKKATELWEACAKAHDDFPIVYRNLSLAYYNKFNNPKKAKMAMEKAWAINESDPRVFLELDQLYKKLDMSFEERLQRYERYIDVVECRDDLYVEYVTLLNMTGSSKKAYDKMMQRQFHPWEGGEGKITGQYKFALMTMAKDALANNRLEQAKAYLNQALTYPRNLGEGKLEGDKDNDVYYLLGKVNQGLDNMEREAIECFRRATVGTNEPAGMMYYNDQPADMIMYQGLAHRQLGEETQAKARFYRLIDYGEKHLFDDFKIDYFAVSLPDFLIFETDYNQMNKAHCYYLMGLGHLGLGDDQKATTYFEEALKIEPSHMHSHIYRYVYTDVTQ